MCVTCRDGSGMDVVCQFSLLPGKIHELIFHLMDSKHKLLDIFLVTRRESTNVKLDQSSFVAKKICYTLLEPYLSNNLSASYASLLSNVKTL